MVHGPWGLRSYTDVRRVLVPVLSAVAGFQQEVDEVMIGDPALGDTALGILLSWEMPQRKCPGGTLPWGIFP